MAIEWSDQYLTGVKDIDEQHQQLFEFINKLSHQIEMNVAHENMELTLKFLGNYVKCHFDFEESCMDRCQCPVAEDNKSSHQIFLGFFQDFQRRFNEEGSSHELAVRMQSAIENWIKNHICRIDVELRPYAKQLQEPSNPTDQK